MRKGSRGRGYRLAEEIASAEIERCRREGATATVIRRRLRRRWRELRGAIAAAPKTFPRVSRRTWYHALRSLFGRKLLELDDYVDPRQLVLKVRR